MRIERVYELLSLYSKLSKSFFSIFECVGLTFINDHRDNCSTINLSNRYSENLLLLVPLCLLVLAEQILKF